jgi:hypothetical protein
MEADCPEQVARQCLSSVSCALGIDNPQEHWNCLRTDCRFRDELQDLMMQLTYHRESGECFLIIFAVLDAVDGAVNSIHMGKYVVRVFSGKAALVNMQW